MSDADLWAAWWIWMGVATVVVLIAATLLVLILVTARRILADAVRALNAAEEIRKNTLVVWQLQASNETVSQILSTVQHIESQGGRLAEALESHAAAGGRP